LIRISLLLLVAVLGHWPAPGIAETFADSLRKADSPFDAGKAATGLMSDRPDPLASEPEFLPVAKAYQLSAGIEGPQLRLDWDIAPGYYLYRDRFKAERLLAGSQSEVLTQQFEPGLKKYDDYYQKDLEVYYTSTRVTLTLAGGDRQYFKIQSQGCADAGLCYPPRTQFLSVDPDSGLVQVLETNPLGTAVGIGTGRSDGVAGMKSAGPNTTLPVILAFALLGGLILNLMPCVFPVLSIKAVGLAAAHLGPHSRHVHGIAYTAGIISTFAVMAALLIVIRLGGHAVGWGFQLQSALFVTFLAYLFFLMGLSFSGLLPLGQRLMGLGQDLTRGHGLKASFMTGALATVVASPCTAPFMGTALGFALTQPAAVAILVFMCLGLGMAIPFLLLSWWPALARRIPAPGAWMETLQQFLAFPLYLSCVWLLWVLGRQTDTDTLSQAVLGLVIITFAAWLRLRKSSAFRALAIPALLVAIALPFHELRVSAGDSLSEPYSTQRLQELRREGKAVFVNLTADWCITCLANEKLALSSATFASLLKQHQIAYLKGDWTNYNPEITALLSAYERSGVPLYLYFPAGEGRARILPQLLTEDRVVQSLSR